MSNKIQNRISPKIVKFAPVSCRRELKYVLNLSQKSQLIGDLLPFVERDPYIEDADKGYVVRTLYFDSFDWTTYYWNIDGLDERFKLRFRAYCDEAAWSDKFWVEIKGRMNLSTYKKRAALPVATYSDLVAKRFEWVEWVNHAYETPVLAEFTSLARRLIARPKILIEYRRLAFRAIHDSNVRITIDTKLVATPSENLFASTKTLYPILPNDQCILEIKVKNYLPHWLHYCICKYGLQMTSISKYILGIRSFYSLTN